MDLFVGVSVCLRLLGVCAGVCRYVCVFVLVGMVWCLCVCVCVGGCSESRALQLPILNVNKILGTNFKILRLIMCQGSDPLGTDLKSIVGFCEQTSKS